MRHQVFGKKLNRDIKERKALFKSLIIALITHGKIKTTLAKAKAIRGLAEKLVTHAKDGSQTALRQLTSFLNKKEVINNLTKKIAPKFTNKLGGYLRIRRSKQRIGDNAQEVILEWSLDKEKEKKDQLLKSTVEKKVK